jgi:hypothetical protein
VPGRNIKPKVRVQDSSSSEQEQISIKDSVNSQPDIQVTEEQYGEQQAEQYEQKFHEEQIVKFEQEQVVKFEEQEEYGQVYEQVRISMISF